MRGDAGAPQQGIGHAPDLSDDGATATACRRFNTLGDGHTLQIGKGDVGSPFTGFFQGIEPPSWSADLAWIDLLPLALEPARTIWAVGLRGLIGLFQAALETTASFFSSQTVAMKNATENAEELIEDLTLSYNKVRQANITREMIEIASGANAR